MDSLAGAVLHYILEGKMSDQLPLFDMEVIYVYDDDGNVVGKLYWIWTWEGIVIAFEDIPGQPAGEEDDDARE